MSMKEKKETPLKAAFTWDELKLNLSLIHI